MRQLPTRKGIRRKPLVYQAERAGSVGIRKLGVKISNLRRQQQAFVYDGPCRKRGNVKELFVLDVRLGNLQLRPFADHIQLALKRVLVHLRRTRYKNLLYIRLRSPRHSANRVSVHRSIPPTQGGQAFFADNSFQNAFTVQPRLLLYRQESHAHGIFAGLGQAEAECLALARKELVRNLDEQPRPVPSLGIAPAGAAVGQVDQDLNSLLNNLMALLSANTGDKPHAAGVVLVHRIIKTLRRRQTVICLPALQKMSPGKNVVGRQRNQSQVAGTEGLRASPAKKKERMTNDRLLDRAHHDL